MDIPHLGFDSIRYELPTFTSVSRELERRYLRNSNTGTFSKDVWSMTIITDIMTEVIRVEMCTGRRPTKVYLGHSQRVRLLQESENLFIIYRNDGTHDRLTACGLPVFLVDAEDHMSCA